MGIFKTYDVRGVYGREIDTKISYKIGRALARFLPAPEYLAAHDARRHSAEMYRAVTRGLIDEGRQVTGIGLASTPQMHFTQIRGKFAGGVMVTASHNPPEYHGFKIFDGEGGSISYAKGLDRLEKMVAEKTEEEAARPGGSFGEEDRLEEYVEFVASALEGERPRLKAVIDVGNGSSGRVFRRLAEKAGLDATILNEAPDGRFPNRDPNPLKPESKRPASRAVLELGADLGAVLDGDGDRVLFVDEKGEAIENYFLSALIAEELLSRQPGAAVVYDLISSRALPERILELGGRPLVSRVGYTFIYDQMVAEDAVFGSETSGHVYFKVSGRYYTESAAYALIVLLKLLQKKGRPLSELVRPLKERYVQSPEINIEARDKGKALALVERRYAAGKLDRLDGLSVSFPDFWFTVRASNTEPVIRLRLEAADRETAESRTRELKELLESAG